MVQKVCHVWVSSIIYHNVFRKTVVVAYGLAKAKPIAALSAVKRVSGHRLSYVMLQIQSVVVQLL